MSEGSEDPCDTSVRSYLLSPATLFGSVETEPLTVRATLIFATSCLADRLVRFCQANPDLSVHVISDVSGVDETGDDVELKILFGSADHGWAERERLYGQTLFPVATPVISDGIRSVEDLYSIPLIEIADQRAGWIRWLDVNSVETEKARFVITDRSDVAPSIAAGGGGIALARAPATETMVSRYGLVRCMNQFEAQGKVTYTKEKQ